MENMGRRGGEGQQRRARAGLAVERAALAAVVPRPRSAAAPPAENASRYAPQDDGRSQASAVSQPPQASVSHDDASLHAGEPSEGRASHRSNESYEIL